MRGAVVSCFVVMAFASVIALGSIPASLRKLSPVHEALLLKAKSARAASFDLIQDEPKTVPELNVTQYCGVWYEVYQDFVTSATFQQNSFCATAEYEPIAAIPGRVSVANKEHYGSVTGPEVNVSGYAYQPNATAAPGQLLVVLHGDNASPFPAPYWVLKLGPVKDDKYQYAIVSDPLRLTLFVLTRSVQQFFAEWNVEVRAFLAANGFTEWYNKPVLLDQTNCTYF